MATTWTLNFESLTNVACTLTITTSSGSGSYSLTGADVPFVMNENDSTSLLDVVRTRSGVIRLVETYQGELDGLRPTTNMSHRVQFTYGSSLQFDGYIQPSDYESEWIASPRILEFPVASKVMLADSLTFPVYLEPKYITIRDVIDTICNMLGIEYFTYPQATSLTSEINSLVIVPYNPQFPSDRPNEDIWAPRSLLYGIEGICRAYGWICFDEPNNLVFVPAKRAASNTVYKKVKVSTGTASQIYIDSVNLDNYTLMSDAGTESIILPLNKVEIKYDGEFPTCVLPFDHTVFTNVIAPAGTFGNLPANHFSCGFLQLQTTEIEGYLYYSNYIDNDKLRDYGAYMVSGGMGDELTEQILIKMALSWAGAGTILKFNFFDHPTGDIIMKMKWKWSNTEKLSDLGTPSRGLGMSITWAVKVDCGDYHYTGNGASPWWTTSLSPSYTYQMDVPLKDNGEVEFYIHQCPITGPLSVYLSLPLRPGEGLINNCGIVDGDLFSIESITIEPAKMRFDKYREPKNKSDIVENSTVAPYDASVTFPMTFWRGNNHFISESENASVQSGKPDMSHMFVTRHCVKPDLRFQESNFHIDEYELDGIDYRIIGYSLDPINDKFTPILLELE